MSIPVNRVRSATLDDDNVETLDVSVGAAAAYLDDTLVGHGDRKRIEQIARVLPAAASSVFGFECHLSGNQHADFLACVTAAGSGREIVAGRDAAHSLPAMLTEHPIWTSVRKFSVIWSTPTSPLYSEVKELWLEFDVDDLSAKLPLPSVFVGLECGRQATESGIGEHQHRWLTDTALPLLLGRHIQRETVDMLRDCFAALPLGAQVYSVGIMLARGLDNFRLCLIGLTADQIPGYLRRVGWLGSFQDLGATISTIVPFAHLDVLDIDVGQTVHPRIGLECAIPWLADPCLSVPHWKRFLDHLVDIGLCPPEQRDGLLDWPGLAPFVTNDILWSTGPADISAPGNRSRGVIS